MQLCRKCKLNYAKTPIVSPLYIRIRYFNIWKGMEKCIIFIDTSILCGIIKFTDNAAYKEVYLAKRPAGNSKETALRESGALNTRPVSDALFSDNDFFDPRDLVQVKYEMLRKVKKEEESISHVAASFGFSRPSFYKISSDFEREGIMGLLPRKRGPRGGHKLTEEVLEFIKEVSSEEQPMSTPALVFEVEKRFGVRVHRRTLERALQRNEKKTPQNLESKGREGQ
jgi:transposase